MRFHWLERVISVMTEVLLAIHLMIAVALVAVVLLQRSEGEDSESAVEAVAEWAVSCPLEVPQTC